MKKIFATVLAVIMVTAALSCLFAGAETAANTDEAAPDASGTLAEGIEWSYYEESGKLEITGNGRIPDYYSESTAPWQEVAKDVVELEIKENITGIGSYAFANMLSLEKIALPESIVSIGDSAFYNTYYYNLEENWTNGVLYIGSYLIDARTDLQRSYIIKDGTACIADFAFSGCTALVSLTLPEGVKYVGNVAFAGCKELKRIALPSTLVQIGYGATLECERLESLTYSGTAEEFAKVSILQENEYLRAAETVYEPIVDTTVEESTTAKAPGNSGLGFGSCSSLAFAAFAAAIASACVAAFVVIKKK